MKICSIYSQKKINKNQLELVEIMLFEAIKSAVRNGCGYFIINMSSDINIAVRNIIESTKIEHHGIILEGVMTGIIKNQKILKHLSVIKFINKYKFFDPTYETQKYMLRSSDLLIVVRDDGDELNDAHDIIKLASDYEIKTEIIPIASF
jgi:hypothetical protein